MNIIDIKRKIFGWVFTNIPLKDEQRVIWSNQNISLPPSGPFVILNIVSGPRKIGSDSFRFTEGKNIQSGPRELTVSIQAFRDDTESMLIDLQASSDEKDISWRYFNNEISIVRVSPITNLSAFVDDKIHIESRSSFDVTLLTQFYKETSSDFFKTVILNGGTQW